ncbi:MULTISPECIES: hypothetical protein [Pseudomonas]|uniref:PRTRC system protein B n=1 Tax=Pseudomonas luteola TaxID=47886 RepID=A0A2X2C008_PSELU|nr:MULTISPECIES: hypothetical protein [Pseudomonas]MBA1250275.1 hypothetical protein [Pseudomonas zeshuii]MBH3441943.1 hypothetical protein [Pseudomonas luteola]MCG7373906.1 prokaryotic E2 ligase family D protein [Pseudomonas luteola]RRW39967.1 hypothetical protein EGJ50_25230 [Pseudomonas luteola]SHJ42180.1 PRTRC system protein B [Pseudomonas zeshuii]
MLNEQISSKALLIHHHKQTGRLDLTSHDIMPLDEGRQFTLGAGRAFSAWDKETLLNVLLDEMPEAEFIGPNILVRGRNMLVWYTPKQIIDIPFRGELIRAPIPGLIYVAQANRALRSFAFKGNARPTPDTELFYVPLGNVYSGGTFCNGNVNLPRNISPSNIEVWQRFVLESTNTHQGTICPMKGIRGFEDLIEFYRNLSAKAKTFPASRLVPLTCLGDKIRLSDVIKPEAAV